MYLYRIPFLGIRSEPDFAATGYQMKYSAGTGCSEKCNMFDNKFLL